MAIAVYVGVVARPTLAHSASLPSSNLIAVVSDVPAGTGRVTRREFLHTLAQQAAQRGVVTPPLTSRLYESLKNAAMVELLEFVWVRGQAAEMRIYVRPAATRAEVERIKRNRFMSADSYRRFLRRFHYTRRDVFDRVEVSLMAKQIEERVVANHRGAGSVDAFKGFVAEFEERWRSRTMCSAEFLIERCSNSEARQLLGDKSPGGVASA